MATRRSSRTLRFRAIYGTMPLSELRTFHPKVHRRPASLSRWDSLRQRMSSRRAQRRDSETLPIWFSKGRSHLLSLPVGRPAGRKAHNGWVVLQSSSSASSLLHSPRKQLVSQVKVQASNVFLVTQRKMLVCMVTQVASSNIEIEAKSLKVPGITLVTQI